MVMDMIVLFLIAYADWHLARRNGRANINHGSNFVEGSGPCENAPHLCTLTLKIIKIIYDDIGKMQKNDEKRKSNHCDVSFNEKL